MPYRWLESNDAQAEPYPRWVAGRQRPKPEEHGFMDALWDVKNHRSLDPPHWVDLAAARPGHAKHHYAKRYMHGYNQGISLARGDKDEKPAGT